MCQPRTRKRCGICSAVEKTSEENLLRARHRLGKFLLRHGRRYTATKSTWSQRHYLWLRGQPWSLPALAQTHEAYLRAEAEAIARLHTVDAQLQAVVMLEPLRERVRRLRCFRGMTTSRR
jgi:hypothetical protein